MSNIKSVQQVLAPPTPHMVGDGFRVHNFFPSGYSMDQQRMSPFYMLDYNSSIEFPPSERPRGVGVHPHRGFETVTIAYKGKVEHHDSTGNTGIIGEGEVQWMTAGGGILHKEYHEREFSKKGGPFQMVQLWVNLPAKDKMTAPKYQAITHENIGKYKRPNGLATVEVIAGKYEGIQGGASTFTPVEMYNVRIKDGEMINISLPEAYNTGLLVIEGNVNINDTDDVQTDHFCLFRNDGTDFSIKASGDALVLLLSGEPINEPIVAHGPFVMNTADEIHQAMRDFGSGKFGELED